MMYSALDGGHPTFTHFPTEKQVRGFVGLRVQLEFDEALFIYHHFVHKVMDNYGKQIHEWKKKWEINKRFQGDAAKPVFVIEAVWTGLKAYWNLPCSVRTYNNCSAARLTSDGEGNLPLPHTSGQIPHAWVVLMMFGMIN
ncbi:hypothetical protein Bca52824_080415 [Brassica carinata]|uniref:Uncharacterized protein n=1 Tax=Brassica carinata TaxID=52824 RepID=A0A8X7PDB1_BRACI|nr:hypothetical protein Bca52824_080415 [Brassica carinata]